MNELIAAAKAVIEWFHDDEPSDLPLEQLESAVERAEKQEVATEFRDWWHSNDYGNYGIHHAQLAWTAAQQAERERIKTIIREVTDGFGNCDRLMEKIDATTE